jgi:hypothetical protein
MTETIQFEIQSEVLKSIKTPPLNLSTEISGVTYIFALATV